MGIIADYEKTTHIFEIECDLCKERYNSKKNFRELNYKEWSKRKVFFKGLDIILGSDEKYKKLYVCDKCFKKIIKNLKKLAEVKNND